jgi:hypothetical protein
LQFSDDKSRLSVRLTDATQDLNKGHLSSQTPLGRAILGAELGDEIEFEETVGVRRRALIESVNKSPRRPRGTKTHSQQSLNPASELQLGGKGNGTKVIVKSGNLNGSHYVMYQDGSIDVTTARGTRHFESLDAMLSMTPSRPRPEGAPDGEPGGI